MTNPDPDRTCMKKMLGVWGTLEELKMTSSPLEQTFLGCQRASVSQCWHVPIVPRARKCVVTTKLDKKGTTHSLVGESMP